MSVSITLTNYHKLYNDKVAAQNDYTALIHKWNALVNKTKAERKEHRTLEVKYNVLVDKTRAERIAMNEEKARLQGKYDDLLKDYKLITSGLD